VRCGVLEVLALEKFGYPAAKVKAKGASVSTIADLLEGEVIVVNAPAQILGVRAGMSGREALERLKFF
jgi:uncharacterized protein YunC (DUF1805 family)